MFEMTVRQRLAALVLLFFLVLGGLLLYLRGNQTVAGEFPVTKGEDKLFVHVCGAVRRPGVFQCKPGLRKFEVIKEAGGTLPEADLNQVNLAEYIQDGEQIYIPLKGEVVKKTSSRTNRNKNQSGSQKPHDTSKPKPVVQFPVDLNTATAEQLEAVPGIGPAMAGRIIQYRIEHRQFETYEDIRNVSGIGPKKLENFRTFLTIK